MVIYVVYYRPVDDPTECELIAAFYNQESAESFANESYRPYYVAEVPLMDSPVENKESDNV